MDLSLRRFIRNYRISIYAFLLSSVIFCAWFGDIFWGMFTGAELGATVFIVQCAYRMLKTDNKKARKTKK